MKIDKPGNTLPASSTGESVARANSKDKSGQTSTAKQPAGTNVSLGSTVAHMQSMESSMGNSPVVNAAKVAEIRQAIRSDDPGAADRLVDSYARQYVLVMDDLGAGRPGTEFTIDCDLVLWHFVEWAPEAAVTS